MPIQKLRLGECEHRAYQLSFRYCFDMLALCDEIREHKESSNVVLLPRLDQIDYY